MLAHALSPACSALVYALAVHTLLEVLAVLCPLDVGGDFAALSPPTVLVLALTEMRRRSLSSRQMLWPPKPAARPHYAQLVDRCVRRASSAWR